MNLFPYAIFLINQLSIYNNQATLNFQGRLIINKVARKPCSVLDNHLSGIRIAPNLQRFFPKMATNLSLRLNLASDWGLPSRYLPVSLVKLLTHRCTIACDRNSTHRQSSFLWHYPPTHVAQSFSGSLFLDARTFLTQNNFKRDYPATLILL